ncbi:MAG: hypothetical protein WKF94_05705 [Solirubrobacteraceae bacterium]
MGDRLSTKGLLANAILAPSGDHAGCVSFALCVVRRKKSGVVSAILAGSRLTVAMSECSWPSVPVWSSKENARLFPSGENEGSTPRPMRLVTLKRLLPSAAKMLTSRELFSELSKAIRVPSGENVGSPLKVGSAAVRFVGMLPSAFAFIT